MKKILLIGNRGYIGSFLETQLIKLEKYSLFGVDSCWFNDPNENTWKMDYYNLDSDFLYDFDVVILLAGHSSVKMCEGNLINSHNNNVRNFIKLLNNLKPSTKFIYASSSSVYGKCGDVANENYMDFIPYNNYDITKHVIDLYVKRFDIEYYGLRFGTVNGYSPILRKDLMINAMYTNAMNLGEIKLYIKNVMRPILGISDLVRAVRSIIDNENDNRGIYNLASFNETAETIAYKVSSIIDKPVVEYETNPNDIIINQKLQSVCYDFKIDTEKFEKTFNFKFQESIKSIIDSLKSNTFIETKRDQVYIYE